jgi:drug/metabolite transporter (DMT)-like permease
MKMPRSVWVGLMLAIVLDTVIQIFWKLAVSHIPQDASAMSTARAALHAPAFYAAMGAFAAQLFNWTRVLARADLSFAQPFTALSYITVLAFSSHSLHEHVSLIRILGVAMIFLGVYFISRTPHETTHVVGI